MSKKPILVMTLIFLAVIWGTPKVLAISMGETEHVSDMCKDMSEISTGWQLRATSATVHVKLANHIDPLSMVAANISVGESTAYAHQRKCFYANGLHWVFYCDDGNLYLKTSTNGTSWSNEENLHFGGVNNGVYFSVFVSGTDVHYAIGSELGGLYYRKGTLNSNGTITWLTSEQEVCSSTVYAPIISVDASNYPWIGYYTGDSYVAKSSLTNGTWQNATGFPHCLGVSYYDVSPVPLSNGNVYVIYSYLSVVVKAVLYNGTWGTEASITDYQVENCKSITWTTKDNNIYFAYLRRPPHQILYKRYAEGRWSSEELIVDGVQSTSYPSISLGNASVYVFWGNGSDIKFKSYSTFWSSEDTLCSSISNFSTVSLNTFYSSSGGNLGVCWTNGSGDNNQVNYYWFKTYAPVYNPTELAILVEIIIPLSVITILVAFIVYRKKHAI